MFCVLIGTLSAYRRQSFLRTEGNPFSVLVQIYKLLERSCRHNILVHGSMVLNGNKKRTRDLHRQRGQTLKKISYKNSLYIYNGKKAVISISVYKKAALFSRTVSLP